MLVPTILEIEDESSGDRIMKKMVMVGMAALLAYSAINVARAGNIAFAVEEPAADSSMTGISNIRGFAVSTVGIDRVKLSINGDYKTDIPYGGIRGDVENNYPNHPDSLHSGFSMAYAYTLLEPGQNEYTFIAVDSDGDEEEIIRTFYVTKFQKNYFTEDAPLSIDESPGMTTGDDVTFINVDMTGQKFAVTMGWDKGKQNITIKETAPASYRSSDQDGSWVGHAKSDTVRTPNNLVCGNTALEVTLATGKMAGYGEDVWSNVYILSGNVSSNGSVTEGLLSAGSTGVVVFNGSITSDTMGGTWSDIYGCSGRWWGIRE